MIASLSGNKMLKSTAISLYCCRHCYNCHLLRFFQRWLIKSIQICLTHQQSLRSEIIIYILTNRSERPSTQPRNALKANIVLVLKKKTKSGEKDQRKINPSEKIMRKKCIRPNKGKEEEEQCWLSSELGLCCGADPELKAFF